MQRRGRFRSSTILSSLKSGGLPIGCAGREVFSPVLRVFCEQPGVQHRCVGSCGTVVATQQPKSQLRLQHTHQTGQYTSYQSSQLKSVRNQLV